MKRLALLAVVALVGWSSGGTTLTPNAEAAGKACLACHEGIERFSDGVMQDDIEKMGADLGDPAGCVVCHGGNPAEEKDKLKAHMGSPSDLARKGGPQNFLPDPGAMPVNDQACGQCHSGYYDRLNKALMNTEAGKLQGNMWSWGVQKDMKVVWGNYDLIDEDGPVPLVGTKAYKKYMRDFVKKHPDQMPKRLKQLPQVDLAKLTDNPNHAGYTYSRQECQRCHVGVTGRDKRGDYRGSGCSACHVPYSNEGFYEGGDPTIDKDEAGHVLTHRMQGSRKTKVKLGDVEFSGIPVETCVACHNRGKRTGVSYQGIMEQPYGSPFNAKGKKQPKMHTKRYLFIKEDLHHEMNSIAGNPQGGMLCQDCHTTIDMHGDGNIAGTTLAQVEIECEDCHGTFDKLPWDLPLGRGEEFGEMEDGYPTAYTEPRGLGEKWPEYMKDATQYEPEDGYLLSARGNPLGNVVKRGKDVYVHSANGLDFRVPLLKTIGDEGTFKSTLAKVSMFLIPQHQNNMECYACHADWVPQCYGCHITVDYSKDKNGKPKMNNDWLVNGNNRDPKTGLTPDAPPGTNGMKSPGKVSETRSYLRWETPVLGINGEGRVSPMMPGCQVTTTVIDPEGKTLVNNKIWETPEGPGIDTAAVQPHTAGRSARSCESCHDNPKALGYGVEGGRFMLGADKDFVLDLKDSATGKIIPQKTQVQIPGIPGLTYDWSAIVSEDGEQLSSVGSHWPLAGPLPEEKRDSIEKTGVCLGCHEERFNPEFWKKVSTPGVMDSFEHQQFMKKALRAVAEQNK